MNRSSKKKKKKKSWYSVISRYLIQCNLHISLHFHIPIKKALHVDDDK